jgi:hypothetical protein
VVVVVAVGPLGTVSVGDDMKAIGTVKVGGGRAPADVARSIDGPGRDIGTTRTSSR